MFMGHGPISVAEFQEQPHRPESDAWVGIAHELDELLHGIQRVLLRQRLQIGPMSAMNAFTRTACIDHVLLGSLRRWVTGLEDVRRPFRFM
jgi:hypothetical protein